MLWFNDDLFNDNTALPLKHSEIETALAAAELDWSKIDPSILGTLFERGLDPDKRSQLGAHYTDRGKIMLIVDPGIVRPWLEEWATAKEEIAARRKLESNATELMIKVLADSDQTMRGRTETREGVEP